MLYLGVWALLLERVWLGVQFVACDAWFLIWSRRRIRERIAMLVRQEGALTAPGAGSAAEAP